jgi:hypothetical protein
MVIPEMWDVRWQSAHLSVVTGSSWSNHCGVVVHGQLGDSHWRKIEVISSCSLEIYVSSVCWCKKPRNYASPFPPDLVIVFR